MGTDDDELRMRIPGHLPETLPLERLLAYLQALTELLEPARELHLLRVEEGSAVPVFIARPTVTRDIRDGWARVRRGEATARQRDARGRLMRLVREDGGTVLTLEDAQGVIAEVTDDESGPTVIGGIQQQSSLTGMLLRVGGKDGSVQLLAEDGRIIGRIHCPRDLARAIAPHLYSWVRIRGPASWERSADGGWRVERMTAQSFDVLLNETLPQTIERLRLAGIKWPEDADERLAAERAAA